MYLFKEQTDISLSTLVPILGTITLLDLVSFSELQLQIGAACFTDSDADLISNSEDIDSDTDGIIVNIEGQTNAGYNAPLGVDTDLDGLDDAYDSDNGGTTVGLPDTDAAALPDYLDIDRR